MKLSGSKQLAMSVVCFWDMMMFVWLFVWSISLKTLGFSHHLMCSAKDTHSLKLKLSIAVSYAARCKAQVCIRQLNTKFTWTLICGISYGMAIQLEHNLIAKTLDSQINTHYFRSSELLLSNGIPTWLQQGVGLNPAKQPLVMLGRASKLNLLVFHWQCQDAL